MSFEEQDDSTIYSLLIELRRRVGTVDKTEKANDGKISFAYLGVKEVVAAARTHLDDLDILVQASMIPETYSIESIGNSQYLQFQAKAVFNIIFVGPAGDTAVFTVPAAAVDGRDKFASTLLTTAMREGLKAALLLFDGNDETEADIRPVQRGNQRPSAQPPSRTSNPSGHSVSEPKASRKEIARLQGVLDLVSEETNETKLEEVGETLQILDLFGSDDNLKGFRELTKAEFTAAMRTLNGFGYLKPQTDQATDADRKLVKGMYEHATKTDPDRADEIKAALKMADIFTSDGQLKKKLTKDQYQTAMRTLADLGFDEPFGTEETPAAKINDMKAELVDAPDGVDIEAPIPDDRVAELDDVKAAEKKKAALAKATAEIDRITGKSTAATKGDQQ